jgi:hypothetical protein
MNKKNKKIRVGVVGSGVISDSHVDSWVLSGLAEIVGIVGHVNFKNANEKALKWNIPGKVYKSVQELIDVEHPDLIDICTPEDAHFEPVIEALDENVPVFSEKIMAPNLKDGFRMMRKASEKKVWAGVNYNYHFFPGIRLLNEIIKSKKEGKAAVIHLNAHSFCFHHVLEAMLWINGMPKKVSAQSTSREWPNDFIEKFKVDKEIIYIPYRFTGRMEYEDGLMISITAHYVPPFVEQLSGLPFQITSIFDSGKVFEITGLDWWNNMVGIAGWLPDMKNEVNKKYLQKGEKNNIISFQGLMKNTAERFIRGDDAESTFIDGWNVMVTDHAFLLSGQNGTSIDIEDLKTKLEKN